jgi:histidyl-tRNA synthetase
VSEKPRTEPARGMRDFLPEDIRRREHVIGVIKRIYERYGFEPLETPAVENIETLLGKYGEEGNQLIFKILMRGEHEASGKADLALRYDLTVPLARVIAHHQAKLPRLFKRYQIQPVWRADRPARGRFREFYQCDVDTCGSTSPVVEAELCAAVSDVLSELGFHDFTIRLNHRKLLTALLIGAGVPEASHSDALVAIDKMDKIGADGVAKELTARGISVDAQAALIGWFSREAHLLSPRDELDALAFAEHYGEGRVALENLREIVSLLESSTGASRLRVDRTLARGLSYYTGAIMEINVPDLAGSLGGGGRYDNLVGMFLGQSIPACGFSLGLERILVVMGERNMFPASLATTPADVMVSAFDAAGVPEAMKVAALLRQLGLRVLVYPDTDKIGKQIKYADSRSIPFVALVGENEIKDGTVTVKHLSAQTQATYSQSEAGAKILEGMTHRG